MLGSLRIINDVPAFWLLPYIVNGYSPWDWGSGGWGEGLRV